MILGVIIFGCIMLLSGVLFGALWILKQSPDILDDLEEEYQLNVLDCHPFDGEPPISLKEYKEQTWRKVMQI